METEKNYRQITFGAGESIESAIKQLGRYKDLNELVYGAFNGQKLYSDIDDMDSAFKKITGKTKAEFDKSEQERSDQHKEEERKHKESIPELTKEWIEKGNSIIDSRYHDLWAKCVPIRLEDLYHGFELGCCLDIVKELNSGCEMETAKTIIENQGHSGMSFGLVCSMVKSFCDRGNEFVSFVR